MTCFVRGFISPHKSRGSQSLQNLVAIPKDIIDHCWSWKQVVKETVAKMATQSRD